MGYIDIEKKIISNINIDNNHEGDGGKNRKRHCEGNFLNLKCF